MISVAVSLSINQIKEVSTMLEDVEFLKVIKGSGSTTISH